MLFLALNGLICHGHGAQRGNFILFADAGTFSILDRYEHQVTSKAKDAIPAWAPFQIVKKAGFLGDEITPAMLCRFRGALFYFLLDEKGELIAEGKGNRKFRILKNCSILNDTIQIVKSGIIGFSPFYSPSSNTGKLEADEMLIRIFNRGNRYYLLRDKNGPQYGWSYLKGKGAWRRRNSSARNARAESARSSLMNRLKARVAEVNRDYIRFFEAFNTATAMDLMVPKWQTRETEKDIVFSFSGNAGTWNALQESIRHLKAELESEILGKGYVINLENKRLVIKQNK